MIVPACISLFAAAVWLLPSHAITERPDRATGVTVTVVVEGATAVGGQIGVAMFANQTGFPEQYQVAAMSEFIPRRAAVDSVVFRDVPPGSYAIAAFHDLDTNGLLKKNMLGAPQEPWGVSRDVRHRLRVPRFDEAKVDVTTSTRLTVRVVR